MPPVVLVAAAAFVLGILFSETGLAPAAIALIAGAFLIAQVISEDRRWLVTGSVVLAFLLLGLLRAAGQSSAPEAPGELPDSRSFEGVIATVPRDYPAVSYAAVDIDSPATARVWAELPPYPNVRQGDVVVINGRFIPFPQAAQRGLAAQHDATGVLYAGSISVSGNTATFPQRFRNRISDEIRQRVQQRIPEPAGAFTTGMMLGDDGAMTEATRDAFRVGGMTHMTAVSGLHVGIIAAGILLLSRFGLVHRWWLLSVALPLIWTFAYVVGMRPSVVRASLMLTLFVLAQLLGRPRDTLNAVVLAAALMIAVDPAIRFDIGFQLSVAATLGIALSLPLIGDRSQWHAAWVVPLSAEAAVEPLILYHFGYYSIVSPFANIIAAPFLAVAMALGILTVLVSLVSGVLADMVAIAAWLPARSIVLIADAAAQVPLLSGNTEPMSETGVWIAYVVLAGILAALYVYLHPAFGDHEGDIGTLYRI